MRRAPDGSRCPALPQAVARPTQPPARPRGQGGSATSRRPPQERAAARAPPAHPLPGHRNRRLGCPMRGHLCRSGEPSARRAAHPEPQRELGEGGGQARPWRLAALALLVLAAAPPATRSDVPGSTQPAPGLCARARRAARRRDGVRGAAGRGAQPRWPVGWGRGPGGRLHRRIAAGEGDDFAGGRLMGISTLALMSVIAGAVLAVLPVAPGPVAPGPVAPPDLWLCRWHLPPSTDALPARRHSAAIVGSNSRSCTLQNSRVLAGLCAGCWSRAEVLDAGGEGGCQRCVVPAVLWDRVLHSGV